MKQFSSQSWEDINGIEVFPFDRLQPDQQQAVAQSIADYTQAQAETEKIVAVEPQTVLHKQLAHVALKHGEVIGYVGAGDPVQHGKFSMTQVGTLCVWPEHRGNTIGYRLVKGLTTDLRRMGQHPYAFCNPRRIKVFREACYVDVTPDKLPPDAFSPFGNQAMAVTVSRCGRLV